MRLALTVLLLPLTALGGFLTPELESAFAEARTGLLPVVIVLAERPAELGLPSQLAGLPRELARESGWRRLSELAARTQVPVLELLESAAADGAAAEITSLVLLNAVGCRLDAATARAAAALPAVQRVVLSHDLQLDLQRSAAPPTPTMLWNIDRVDAEVVWEEPYGYTGAGVVVAVLDTGCDIEHPDLADHAWSNPDEIPDNREDDDGNGYVDDIYGWDFYYHNNDILGPVGGHGSHVAGTVAGDGSAGYQTGVAPDARIMSLQSFSDGGSSTEYIVWRAFDYAVAEGADILNCSWGWRQWNTSNQVLWREECEAVLELGVVICAAAGNEGDDDSHPPPDNIRTPGDVPGVITVGATDAADELVYFSSRGPAEWDFAGHQPPYDDWPHPPGLVKPDLSAPGSTILSLDGRTGGYRNLQGTSMATPHVAGAAALLLEALPELTPAEIKSYLEESSLDLGEAGKDNAYGAGRLNCLAALVAARSGLRFDSFAAADGAAGIALDWAVTKPEEIAGYQLMRRVDGGSWSNLNTNPLTGERYLDRDVARDRRYEYLLLAELNTGGTLSCGPVGLIYGSSHSPPRPALRQPYPCPAGDELNIRLELSVPGEATLVVYDLAGRRRLRRSYGSLAAGTHTLTLELRELLDGVYLLALESAGTRELRRFVVSR